MQAQTQCWRGFQHFAAKIFAAVIANSKTALTFALLITENDVLSKQVIGNKLKTSVAIRFHHTKRSVYYRIQRRILKKR